MAGDAIAASPLENSNAHFLTHLASPGTKTHLNAKIADDFFGTY